MSNINEYQSLLNIEQKQMQNEQNMIGPWVIHKDLQSKKYGKNILLQDRLPILNNHHSKQTNIQRRQRRVIKRNRSQSIIQKSLPSKIEGVNLQQIKQKKLTQSDNRVNIGELYGLKQDISKRQIRQNNIIKDEGLCLRIFSIQKYLKKSNISLSLPKLNKRTLANQKPSFFQISIDNNRKIRKRYNSQQVKQIYNPNEQSTQQNSYNRFVILLLSDTATPLGNQESIQKDESKEVQVCQNQKGKIVTSVLMFLNLWNVKKKIKTMIFNKIIIIINY